MKALTILAHSWLEQASRHPKPGQLSSHPGLPSSDHSVNSQVCSK